MGLLSHLFNFLSWPSLGLLLPLYASFRSMESQSRSKNQQCLSFWVLFALFAMLEHAFGKLLLLLPFWPSVKGIVTLLLVIPYFGGASYVYKSYVRPYILQGSHKLSPIPKMVFNLTQKCLTLFGLLRHNNCFSSIEQKNFSDVTDKIIVKKGQEDLKGSSICQLIFEPQYDNTKRVHKPIISNGIQKEWSCAICLISTSSETSFIQHLRGKPHKAKEEVTINELAWKLHYNSPYIANLVNLEKWRGLISPVVGSIRWCSWQKPEPGWVKLNTDGSIDREKAGLGGLLRDPKGDPICAFVSKARLTDIFMVELCAIWRGLVLARGLGVRVVWVESDSLSAVKTINKKQFHSGKADKCLDHIWGLLMKFDMYRVTHTLRETNRAADFLSKMVCERNDAVLWPTEFPASLQNIIKDDADGMIYQRR